jgi:ketosteroid isomerase-like protein
MKRLGLLISYFIFLSSPSALAESEIEQVKQFIESYRKAMEQKDQRVIVKHFADEMTVYYYNDLSKPPMVITKKDYEERHIASLQFVASSEVKFEDLSIKKDPKIKGDYLATYYSYIKMKMVGNNQSKSFNSANNVRIRKIAGEFKVFSSSVLPFSGETPPAEEAEAGSEQTEIPPSKESAPQKPVNAKQ